MHISHSSIFIILLTAGVTCHPNVQAESSPNQALPAMKSGQTKKLHRGFKNSLLGWQEIPAEIDNFSDERDWFEAWTTGVAVGVGRAIARTGIGVAEVLSAPYETTENNEPLILPQLPSEL